MDRVAAARSRLEANRAFALQVREAGPPCSGCRFKTLLNKCSNPAYAEQRFDAPKGVYEESYLTNVRLARASDGLCGPEALLFEPHGPIIEAAQPIWSNVKRAYLWGVAALAAAGILAGLVH